VSGRHDYVVRSGISEIESERIDPSVRAQYLKKQCIKSSEIVNMEQEEKEAYDGHRAYGSELGPTRVGILF
jgi:hypothetical protein